MMILCGQSSSLDLDALAHGATLILTGIFACIAALSSIHNGRVLRSQNGAPKHQAGKPSKQKDAPPDDWFKPPEF